MGLRLKLDGVAQTRERHGADALTGGGEDGIAECGREGRQAQYAREFAERLHARTGLEVRLWDERLTTVEAQRVLRESGIGIEKRAKAVDKLAAQILLRSYLAAQGNE